jgi:glycosyltransferase involved in cell wall biosynthesis
MKKVLHVVNVYFVIPYFIGDQFLHFKKLGYDMHVICSPSVHLDCYAGKMQFSFKEVKIMKAISPLTDITAIIEICKYIKKNKIDIVVGHTPKGALLAMIASWLMNVSKRIYFRHGLVYETMKGLKRWLMINADRLTALCSTKIVCVSNSVLLRSLEDHLNPEKKQIILGKGTCGGIDTLNKFNSDLINEEHISLLRKELAIEKDTFVIGYVGRLVRDKGIQDLICAFDLLKAKHPNKKLSLLLIGGYEKRDAVPQWIINRIQDDPHIINTGFIFENIENYYALINVLVLPSYREGFGMSVIEASSMKIPVLTTRETGCIDSIIENVTGKYVDHTPESISNGIISFYDKAIATEFGLKGREFASKNFDFRILMSEIEKLYI